MFFVLIEIRRPFVVLSPPRSCFPRTACSCVRLYSSGRTITEPCFGCSVVHWSGVLSQTLHFALAFNFFLQDAQSVFPEVWQLSLQSSQIRWLSQTRRMPNVR